MIKKITTECQSISQISDLEHKYFSAPLTENELIKMGQNDIYEILALEDNNRVLAYIAATVGPYECQIIKIASAEQKQGYGKEILGAFIERHPGTKICLEVRESNKAAQGLYTCKGFVTDGVRKNLYDSPLENGIIMHLDNEGT